MNLLDTIELDIWRNYFIPVNQKTMIAMMKTKKYQQYFEVDEIDGDHQFIVDDDTDGHICLDFMADCVKTESDNALVRGISDGIIDVSVDKDGEIQTSLNEKGKKTIDNFLGGL